MGGLCPWNPAIQRSNVYMNAKDDINPIFRGCKIKGF